MPLDSPLQITLIDPVVCVSAGSEPTRISLESEIAGNRQRFPGDRGNVVACASIAIGVGQSSCPLKLNISAAGLRKLARAALHMARDVEERQRSLEVR